MENIKDLSSSGFDPMSPLDGLDGDGVDQVISGISEVTSGLPYESYVSIPKLEATPMLHVLDCLSKLAASLSGKNVYLYATTDWVYVKYDNSAYQLVYRFVNSSGKTLRGFSIPIVHLKKLFGNVVAHLVLVFQDASSGSGQPGLYAYFSGNLVYVETQSFDASVYDFQYEEMTDKLDGDHIRQNLLTFSSLLAYSERTSERQLITRDGYSYINIGSILGRVKSFFGPHDCILSRILVDVVSTLASTNDGDISACFSEDHMSMDFGGFHYLRFAYTSGEAVSRFMSPLFKSAFLYDSSVLVEDGAFRQLLTVVGSLDYFTDTVRVDFNPSDFVVTAHRKDGEDAKYTFAYKEGLSSGGAIVVSIPVLLGVLSKSTADTKYSCSSSSLVVDLGDAVYCVRSVLMQQ